MVVTCCERRIVNEYCYCPMCWKCDRKPDCKIMFLIQMSTQVGMQFYYEANKQIFTWLDFYWQ